MTGPDPLPCGVPVSGRLLRDRAAFSNGIKGFVSTALASKKNVLHAQLQGRARVAHEEAAQM